ncbi:hypothetical protein Tco_1203543 [Tanacetum coccineum]
MAPLVSTKFVLGLVACQVSCRVGPSSDLDTGSCTRAREVMIFCTIKSKPLALPWGRTPRLDSGVRVSIHCQMAGVGPLSGKGPQQSFRSDADVLRTDRLIDGSADGSSTSGSADGSSTSRYADGTSTNGSADGSLGSGPKPMRIWALPWPVIDRLIQVFDVVVQVPLFSALMLPDAPHLGLKIQQDLLLQDEDSEREEEDAFFLARSRPIGCPSQISSLAPSASSF